MNKNIYKVLSFTAFILLVFSSVSMAQVTSSTSSKNTNTAEVAAAQTAVNKVLFDSGVSFTEGLIAYTDSNRPVAGEKFNKSVEVFLSTRMVLFCSG